VWNLCLEWKFNLKLRYSQFLLLKQSTDKKKHERLPSFSYIRHFILLLFQNVNFFWKREWGILCKKKTAYNPSMHVSWTQILIKISNSISNSTLLLSNGLSLGPSVPKREKGLVRGMKGYVWGNPYCHLLKLDWNKRRFDGTWWDDHQISRIFFWMEVIPDRVVFFVSSITAFNIVLTSKNTLLKAVIALFRIKNKLLTLIQR